MGDFVNSVGNLLGGTSNGADFQAQSANILNPVDVGQAHTAYDQTQSGIQQQQNFANALAAQNGIGNQSQVFNQQQQLAQALQNQAAGNGPNPAQAALAQQTGANVANQAALMAGQRGVGSNVGLAARNIGQQGAATQQQAVGQGATLQAQQQIAAQQQLQAQQQAMAALATQQVGQQAGAIQGYNAAAQGQQGQLLNSIASQNNAAVSNQSNINNANQAMAAANANQTDKFTGGVLNGAAGLLMPKPKGGGGGGAMAGGPDLSSLASVAMLAYKGGMIPDHLKAVHEVYHGGYAASGGQVAGKAEVKGDSPKNDTVPTMLSPGEIVIPKHVIESDDPVKGAAAFVEETLAGKLGKKSKEHDDFKEALKSAISNRKSK